MADPLVDRSLVETALVETALVDKGDDAEETDEGRARRRRRNRLLIVAATLVALIGGGLLIASPWSDGAEPSGRSAPTTVGPGGSTTEAPALSGHLVVGDFGEALTVQWANDGEQGSDDMGAPTSRLSTVMLAADGADPDGPWLSAGVELLDRSDRKSFDPAIYFGDSSGRKVMIGSVAGYYVKSAWTGSDVLVFGPVNDGFSVTFSAAGISQADLVTIAEELVLEEADDDATARPVFGPKADELGLHPIASYEQDTWGFGGLSLTPMASGFASGSVVVSYLTEDGNNLTVTNGVAPAGLDVLAVARVLLGDATEVTVHGLPAIQGGDLSTGDMVVWVEGGRTIAVSGDVDDLLAAAEAVEVADDAEWDDLLAAVEANMGMPGPAVTESWLIGAGDLPDATTWTIDGGLDDDGRLVLCSGSFSNDGSSMNGCNGAHEVGEPSLFMGDLLSTSDGVGVGLVATVPNDLAGTVLRFTDADGVVSEVPLKVIRDDWTFLAAAIAVSTPGTAALVAADGSEVATLEITDDMLGTGAGPSITTATAVAVSGG